MAEPRADQTPDDETLVTPRFDEEETVLAQPVVRLDAAEDLPPGEPAVAAAHSYVPRAHGSRRPWPLAVILVSALVGSVIGGTGLYFFQKHRRAEAAQPAATTPAEATQPAPAPAAEQASAPVEETQPAPAPSVEEAAAVEPIPEPVEDEDEDDARKADPAPEPARNVPVREEEPRRGKKGDRDDAVERRERNRSSDDDAPAARNEARRVDAIVYPTRREERRAQRQAERRARRAERQADRQADRLRAIFEGEPE